MFKQVVSIVTTVFKGLSMTIRSTNNGKFKTEFRAT
jgi:hypothetical protein